MKGVYRVLRDRSIMNYENGSAGFRKHTEMKLFKMNIGCVYGERVMNKHSVFGKYHKVMNQIL